MTLVEYIMDMESRVHATFEKLRKELRSQFSEQQLAIMVTRNNFIPNTISYQAIESLVGREFPPDQSKGH